MKRPIELVADALLKSKYLIALTGAGISAESGIPTFRGKNGLWRKFRAEDLATPEAFSRNPKLVWEWYSWRISMILKADPNPAHYALAILEDMGILKAIITQNVDDLHERAGTKNLIKIHGDILTARCTSCRYTKKLDSPPNELPPKCPNCGSLLRPGVVWFGEPLPKKELDATFINASKADGILVVGTSGVVYPAASIPLIVKERGGFVVEVNIKPSNITQIADFFIQGKAGEILPRLIQIINNRLNVDRDDRGG